MLAMFCFACTSSLSTFWRGRTRLQDLRPWCEALLFSLYKGKGDRSDLSNYRGIVLLDVVSKLVSRVINSRLVWVVEQVCGETENGYRKNRGTTDCTFLLRRLLESWRRSRPLAPEGSQDLFLLFVDLQKAFDSVPRESLFQLLSGRFGLPDHIVAMLRHLHFNFSARVCQQSRCSDPFPMATGVRQGSVEGPSCLCGCCFTVCFFTISVTGVGIESQASVSRGSRIVMAFCGTPLKYAKQLPAASTFR